MAKKLYFLASMLTVCLAAGTRTDPLTKEPGTPPKTEDWPKGKEVTKAELAKVGFTAEDWKDALKTGSIVERVEEEDEEDLGEFAGLAVPGSGGAGNGETVKVVESDSDKKDRILLEGRELGVTGLTKNMAIATIEAKIAEFKNKRTDGTTPSIQDGAGRADASSGAGMGDAAAAAAAAATAKGEGGSGEGDDAAAKDADAAAAAKAAEDAALLG